MKVSAWLLPLALVAAACNDQAAMTAIPRPDTPPSSLLTFDGTLQPGGADTHTFSVSQSGEVEVTLTGAALVGDTSSAPLTLGLGLGPVSNGGACLVTYAVDAVGGTKAQITGTGQVGNFCVNIYDVGKLTGPAIYTVTVATP